MTNDPNSSESGVNTADPAPTTPRFPILQNLGKLLLQYGPILLQWLISSGIIKLPPGVTLPPLPTSPNAQLEPSTVQKLHATDAEVVAPELYRRLAALAAIAAEANTAAKPAA